MVRFPCFNGQVHSDKAKKTVTLSVDSMQKTLEDCVQNQAPNDFKDNSLNLKDQGDAILNGNANHVMISSIAYDWKSEEINSKYNIGSNRGVSYSGHIKKSLSLGSGLDRAARTSVGNDSDDETDLGNSLDGFHQNNGMVVPHGGKDLGISVPHQCQGALLCDSFQVGSELGNNGPIFSIGDTQHSEKGGSDKSDARFSGESAVEFSEQTLRKPPILLKSSSFPIIGVGSYGECSALTYFAPHTRSSEDLAVLELRQKEMVIHDFERGTLCDQERDASILNSDTNNCKNLVEAGYDSYNYVGSAKDCIVPIMDELSVKKSLHGESSDCQREELPSKYFQIKRVEEWLIDVQHCSSFEETNDGLSNLVEHQVQKGSTVADNLTARRFDGKITPGMEAAKKYISSLSATATTVQLANHGLAVIPFLSAFVSLRALNLSGNAIARITAGALPRGLHILNLSKNNISNIEGLRELTRLRVLDLSYNRIVRIGHGLAACSSLKELYLAGNKISEVEGLHRLLKLNVLDLRFNKISTAKCLDQLAANYSSLQAISLDGNPAQKNVGDEQLKKHLQGFLPHLAYYNGQSIKAGTLKDGADRLARLGITADRGLRSEHKSLRKGSHSASAHKISLSSSIRGHRNQAAVSSKPSKGRQGRLPPTVAKATTAHRQHFHDFGGEVRSSRPDLSIRRSQSDGTLSAL